MVRDGESPASADRILKAQLNRQQRLNHADDVLENAGTRDELERKVLALHARYLNFANELNQGGVKRAE